MKTLNLEIKNPGPILTELLNTFKHFEGPEQLYLELPRERKSDAASLPLVLDAFGVNEQVLPEILQVLGIRSLTLTSTHDLDPIIRISTGLTDYLGDEEVVKELQDLFRKCRTIAFDDWSKIADASELWPVLLAEVIAPLENNELEFIFYLGDPTQKLSFQVDEALEIISGFSDHGAVTLALDENEAIGLWKMMNGIPAQTAVTDLTHGDLKKKYFSIFRTIGVTHLLIYSRDNAILFSDEQQFVISRKAVNTSVEIANDARQNFIAGYSLGFLMGLNLSHCIALGLIIFGSSGENDTAPDQKMLFGYIEQWIADLEKPETIYLYQ